MKHFWKWPLRCLCVLLALLALCIAGIAMLNHIQLRTFYKTAQSEFQMPGISDSKFDMQGIDYDEDSGLFFFTGYMRDGSANPVYLVDAKSGKTLKAVRLLTSEGADFCGHAGGIAVTDRFVYIAGSVDCCLYVYDKQEILQADNEETATCIGAFPTATSDEDGVKASFLTNANGKIYVGEFHLPLISAYSLRENHKIRTANGNNSALMVGFEIDPDAPLGLSPVPSVAYSLPDRVQGLCFNGSHVVLSVSIGPTPSTIYYTEPVLEGTFTIMNAEVPLYSLKKISEIQAPPACEEIDVYNGRLYIASELYNAILPGYGQPWGAKNCWSIPAKQ